MKARLGALLSVLLALALGCAAAEVRFEPSPASWQAVPTLRLTAFSVGQGDALLLECGGERMMIDGGPDKYRADLKAALDEMGITEFKYLLNTHYHDDHINGLYRLMQYGFTVGEYLHPYSDYYVRKDKWQSRAVKEAQKQAIPVRRVYDGDTLTLGGAQLTLLRHTDIENGNAKSVVTHVAFGESTLLLCADIIGQVQAYYAEHLPASLLDVDIVKVPHHGVTPMNSAFLDAASPAFAIVTAPEKRAGDCLKQLGRGGIPFHCTGGGALVMETDGDDWYIYRQS